MRVRFKGPSGCETLQLPDDATVEAVFDRIRLTTGIPNFSLKYGPPMAMRSLDAYPRDTIAKSLGLHGETLTIVPDERQPVSSGAPSGEGAKSQPVLSQHPTQPVGNPDDIIIPWPEREGTLLLRVMPSDNSCLFTAFGGALPKHIAAQQLRRMMADYIMEHPDIYSEAVLGTPPSEYCRSIQDPDRWGGGIELSILSAIFDIEICTYDVQAQNLMKFGETKRDRCILVFSGIHYDRVAFSFSEFPHGMAMLPPDLDRTIWPTADDEVLEKAHALVQKLRAAHYYTDTQGLILKCDAPGCSWIGSGQMAGRRHAEQTGHVDLSEICDPEEDNVLRACDAPGCQFMSQGEITMRQHSVDTGHEKFSVIPDC